MVRLLHCLLLATCLTLLPAASASTAWPPNILLILVDDLGKEWIGC